MILTERATTTMEEMPNSAPSEALIKAEAPKLVSLLEEMKNGLDVLTQEPRFLCEEETMLVPPWLEPPLSSTFFTICRVHDDLTQSECNMESSGSIDYNNASLREILDQTMIGNMNNSSGMSSADPFVSIYIISCNGG